MQSSNFYKFGNNTIINLNHVLVIELDGHKKAILLRVTQETYESLTKTRDLTVSWGDGSPFIALGFTTYERAKEVFNSLTNTPIVAAVVED